MMPTLPDFGRGDGDPLGGPTVAEAATAPDPYQVWNVRLAFKADRGGDAWGIQEIAIAFDQLLPGTPEHEALMLLWRKASADALARMRANGVQLDIG